ncbi:antithrombin-III [Clarias gariepinus]|uniref:antithrombin-III n=1 Tax=Clarias gariepinus TaxID=13013 RepID=UPI00234E3708|nr:antithrombin-III [Clarias gariepinus]
MRIKWVVFVGAVWILSISTAHAGTEVCNMKPKDLPLEPVCIHRNPNVLDNEEESAKPQETMPESTNPRVWELSKANGRFALSLFKQVSKGKSEETNIFMSPLSISTAFAMTKLGACNSTLEQIMRVFEFDSIKEKTSDQVHFFFAKLNCRLYRKTHNSVELVSANRLFGEETFEFNENYQNISEMVYGAKLLPLNFKEKPELSRQKINEWISEKTNHRINNTLPKGSVNANTILALVNTIYFKGQWKHKFNRQNSMEDKFHVSETHSCSVQMMYQENTYRYGYFQNDKVQVLEMFYNGNGISMLIVLPDKNVKLAKVEEHLSLNKLDGWLSNMEEKPVGVRFPRFRMEEDFSLKEMLQAMGLQDIFSVEHASLPGMVSNNQNVLYVTDAFHKAFLEVNEEGSEAAAATAILFGGRSLNPNREVFIADRPFLLFIRETTINTLIFAGRVANPCSDK